MKKDKISDEEKLRAALNGENPFNVPSGYFEELPGILMNKINELPDFDKTSPLNPFVVPDGYFENLPSSIAEKIVTRKSKLETWFSTILRPRIAIPIAFATIIMLTGIYLYKQNNLVDSPIQEITFDDLENSTYIQSIDEELFVDLIASQNDPIKDESIEQYLLDNNIELNQIENKL